MYPDMISDEMDVIIRKTHKNAINPERKTKYSAGYDLYTCESGEIPAGETRLVNFGFSLYMQKPDMCCVIYSRSGLKYEKGIEVCGGPSIIDADFHHTIQVPVRNSGTKEYKYKVHEGLLQMRFEKTYSVKWLVVRKKKRKCKGLAWLVDAKGSKPRRRGGFGSTGLKPGEKTKIDAEERVYETV